MINVFISQPMNGKSNELIRAEHEKWADKLKDLSKEELNILDTVFDGFDPEDETTPLKCLGLSLYMMADADVVVFTPGWSNSRGCNIEYHAAKAYKKKIVDYEEDIE